MPQPYWRVWKPALQLFVLQKILSAKECRPPEAPLGATLRSDSVGKLRKKIYKTKIWILNSSCNSRFLKRYYFFCALCDFLSSALFVRGAVNNYLLSSFRLIVIFIAMKTKVTRNTIPTVVTIVIWTRFPLISASARSMGTATEIAPLKSPNV